MTKVGIIGFGGIADVHYRAYKNIKDAQVVAVADVRYDMAKEKLGDDINEVNVYKSMEELLENENVDMVDICTPTYLHADMTVKALKSGVHVMCEKPMAINSDEARKMFETAKKSDKFLMIGHVVRFMKPYIFLKNIIDGGELGKLLQLDMKRLSGIPTWSWEDWMRNPEKSGGTLLDLSIHDLDWVQYALGKPNNVSCVYHKLKNNNDFVVSELIYDGMFATVSGGWYNTEHFGFKAEYLAVFENGVVELKDGKLFKNGKEIDLAIEAESSGINLPNADGHPEEIRYFVECVKSGVKPEIVTPEDALETIELVEELIENCREI